MAITIQVTQEDIDNLATKLDEFAQVLNEREREVLLAIFGMAGKEIKDIVAQGSTTTTTEATPQLPSLSAGFREAFTNGVGTNFEIDTEAGQGEGVSISVKGEWSRG